MAKPTFVTLPVLLLFLDYWPLRCFRSFRESLPDLLIEKIPLFALSAASILVTVLFSAGGSFLAPFGDLPLVIRVQNAFVAIAGYLAATLWPAGLAFYYPHAGGNLAAWKIVSSTVFVCGVTIPAFRCAGRHPAFSVGWGWFLLTLLPVIGLTQIGGQVSADRFTYLPHAGLFLGAVFGGSEVISPLRIRRGVTAGLALSLVLSMGVASRVQTRYWRDSETLYGRGLPATRYNWVAHHNLGVLLYWEGRTAEAVAHFRETLRIRPGYAQGYTSLAQALEEEGDVEGSFTLFEEAVRRDPSSAYLRRRLADALKLRGRIPEAVSGCREAVRLDPEDPGNLLPLGFLLSDTGEPAEAAVVFDEAVRWLEKAAKLLPRDPVPRLNLGLVLADLGRYEEAAASLRDAERIAGEGSGENRTGAPRSGQTIGAKRFGTGRPRYPGMVSHRHPRRATWIAWSSERIFTRAWRNAVTPGGDRSLVGG